VFIFGEGEIFEWSRFELPWSICDNLMEKITIESVKILNFPHMFLPIDKEIYTNWVISL
jgi:hypothetical protein